MKLAPLVNINVVSLAGSSMTQGPQIPPDGVDTTILSTFLGKPSGLPPLPRVNQTTFTNDCSDTNITTPPGWSSCPGIDMSATVSCVRFPDGSVGRGVNCQTNVIKDGGPTVAFRCGYIVENIDGNVVTKTAIFPNITIDYLDQLPSQPVASYVFDKCGIKKLNINLSRTMTGDLINAQIMELTRNSITSIDGIKFPSRLVSLNLSSNGIETIGTVDAGTLIHLILSNNAIKSLEGATFPTSVQDLDLAGNHIRDLKDAKFPPGLQNLSLNSNLMTSLASAPQNLQRLEASYMQLKNFDLPYLSNLVVLSLINSNLTEIYANFPPTLRYLFLHGNDITAFYANVSQFELLSQNVTSSCAVFDWPQDSCRTLFSTTFTNATCQGHLRTEMLYGMYPVCIIENTTTPTLTPTVQSSNNTTTVLAVGITGIVVLLAAALLAHWTKLKHRRKWYNDQHGGPFHKFEEQTQVVANDIRTDDAIVALRIPANRIDRGVELGRGGYGVVYLATVKYAGKKTRQVAMKRLLPEKAHSVADMEAFMDEIRLSVSLCHPNIVEFVGVAWTTLSNVSLLTEYMSMGDVWSLLEDDRDRQAIRWNIDPAIHMDLDGASLLWNTSPDIPLLECGLVNPHCQLSKFSILSNVVDALVYLHSLPMPIIHRDVKARNILVNDALHVKLTDFGTSRERVLDFTMTSEIGTIPWVAPEVLKGVRYSEKADIYSIGVLISELDTVEVPYSNLKTIVPNMDNVHVQVAKTKIMMMVVAGELRPCVTQECPDVIYDITRRCVAYNPDDRPSAAKLQQWLRQIRGGLQDVALGDQTPSDV
ncbi:Aste57867_24806 [Aphanomyces stellatus]|uniref:Aste57867_24806 protein n=1 Tax=Aphanomyces stellatus TaxID=120398 RepID=A0A485LSV5_9STRA|nr:hypothetical protein As57867_024728 [Aphanomyces stellatus]VFU01441.1 Aste57867_24806 [Aphanomyces stellatus]